MICIVLLNALSYCLFRGFQLTNLINEKQFPGTPMPKGLAYIRSPAFLLNVRHGGYHQQRQGNRVSRGIKQAGENSI